MINTTAHLCYLFVASTHLNTHVNEKDLSVSVPLIPPSRVGEEKKIVWHSRVP